MSKLESLFWGASTLSSMFFIQVAKSAEGTFADAHGADILLPMYIVSFSETLNHLKYPFRSPREKLANQTIMTCVSFLGCSVFEYFQKIGWYEGTYDPLDFLAYGAGAGAAIGLAGSVECIRRRIKKERTVTHTPQNIQQ